MISFFPYQHRTLFSLFVWVGIAVFLIVKLNETARWKEKKIIIHDVGNYYGYLPATFIYNGDYTLKFKDTLSIDIQKQIEHNYINGYRVFKMTSGCSILWIPFFLTAQTYINHYPSEISEKTGYSRYNHLAISIAAIIYVLIGLLFLRAVFIEYFNDIICSLLLIISVAASNLYYYTIYESGMSHVYSFFLFSALLFFTVRWHKSYGTIDSICVAFILGMITLIRPTNIIAVIIPLFWGIRSIGEFWERVTKLFENKKVTFLMILFFVLPFIPQVLYWKVATGNWLVYSYNNEGFYWKQPMFLQGLFGYRKGWFTYSPVMILGIPGMILSFYQKRDYFFSIFLFFLLSLYLTFAWWCWWYGGSFGMRSLIDFYPLWLMLIGVLIQSVTKRFSILYGVFFLIVYYSVHLNLFQTKQYSKGIIHYDSMTKDAYWFVWGKNKYEYNPYLQYPIYDPLNRMMK